MGNYGFLFLETFLVLMLMVEVYGAGRLKQVEPEETMKRILLEGDEPEKQGQEGGTTWAVLVAGSSGYDNYRHQADICHAYQVLKKGGLKDENIVVFMYDDIARSNENPRRGIIINHPKGHDVYAGVPKDYTGRHVTVENFYAVLLGNKTAVKGGSGKVVNSKPNDRIFLFYVDHGSPGTLGMPNLPYLYAKDFIKVLKKKHASGSYKEMVIYIEACEAGSIFDGLLPEDINIYVTTASNAEESSYATYCPDTVPPSPPEFDTCLGDLYSVAWMEDSDTYNRKMESLKQQYLEVKKRTAVNNTYEQGSHVMEYGNKDINAQKLHLFQGFDPTSKNISPRHHKHATPMNLVHQRDSQIHFLWNKYKNSKDGSTEKTIFLKQITETLKHRIHLDGSIKLIGTLLFGPRRGDSVLHSVRPSGSPLVDDWECLKSMVRSFETHCGSLTKYGMKYTRAFANLCNNGVTKATMDEASMAACSGHKLGQWDPSILGYSA